MRSMIPCVILMHDILYGALRGTLHATVHDTKQGWCCQMSSATMAIARRCGELVACTESVVSTQTGPLVTRPRFTGVHGVTRRCRSFQNSSRHSATQPTLGAGKVGLKRASLGTGEALPEQSLAR